MQQGGVWRSEDLDNKVILASSLNENTVRELILSSNEDKLKAVGKFKKKILKSTTLEITWRGL